MSKEQLWWLSNLTQLKNVTLLHKVLWELQDVTATNVSDWRWTAFGASSNKHKISPNAYQCELKINTSSCTTPTITVISTWQMCIQVKSLVWTQGKINHSVTQWWFLALVSLRSSDWGIQGDGITVFKWTMFCLAVLKWRRLAVYGRSKKIYLFFRICTSVGDVFH